MRKKSYVKPPRKDKRVIKTAIIADPAGSLTSGTAEEEIQENIKNYTLELGHQLKVHTPSNPEGIEEGTELVLYDYGGMGFGSSLTERNAHKIVEWAKDHPTALVVIVSSFTYNVYVKHELRELGLEDEELPNLTHIFSDMKGVSSFGIPDWWKASL